MKAAVLTGVRQLRVEEVEEPRVADDEVLVKVMACGLCPADYRVYAGLSMWREPPAILGHEPAGLVVEVGSKVRGIGVGDRVAVDLGVLCGRCRPCLTGSENLCEGRRPAGEGALAQYCLAKADRVRMFHRATFEEAAFVEPLSCVLNGIRRLRVGEGDTVAIIGSGPMGLMHMQVLKLRGARTIMVDLRADRLGVARRLGADYTVDASREDVVSKVKGITRGYGADRVVVTVGRKEAIEMGMAMLATKGLLNIFAATHPATSISIDPNEIHYRELTITGSYDKKREDLDEAVQLIDGGRVDVGSLITHRLPLAEVEEGFRLMERGEALKVIVKPNE